MPRMLRSELTAKKDEIMEKQAASSDIKELPSSSQSVGVFSFSNLF
jgi:hypothetical protein